MNQMRGVKSRYDFSLDNRQVVLIISGLILVLMLSFLMGTLFGRNLAQMSDQDKQVAAAPAATNPAPVAAASEEAPNPASAVETASAAPGAADSTRADLIRNLESMKVPSGKAAADQAGAPAAAGPAEPAAAPPAMASLNPDSPPSASVPAAPHNDAAKPADKPAKPSITRPVIPMGTFTIQLASLPDKGDALEVVKQLQSRRYDAYMLTVTLPGKGIFYRVRVGHYTDLNQAKKALAILQSREGKYFDAWITE
jgi:cell division septation protein DedD